MISTVSQTHSITLSDIVCQVGDGFPISQLSHLAHAGHAVMVNVENL